ncbi:hypothetical protein [Cyanobacterium aponinum]|uniref:Uncharacterized protein n=1 Tax=Cyanobacterium aponinum (strain PCC 10605) TaxID=755178 RepID=K9Z320_CYAAP|nr:hypothetical protein [Cyanobacterium aponinum]AFZ53554.1 hypothetical protein Cyan10605_1443 [Cyanobacterium aponinum PCC 10605]
MIKETNYLKKENRLPLKLHTAVGDATRIAIIHREFYKHKEKYIHLIQEYLSHSYLENNPVEKYYKKEGSKKSILQNIPLNLEQIKRIKEGILLLLSLDKLTEEEKQLEEDFIKKNKNYLLVKKLEENNYYLANFTTELLKINRFLNLNFNISLKDLYEIDFSQLVNK